MTAWIRGIAGPIGLLLAAQTVVITADSRAPRGARAANVAQAPSAPVTREIPATDLPELPNPLLPEDAGKAKVFAQARVLGQIRPLLEDEEGHAIEGGIPKDFLNEELPAGIATRIENPGALRGFHSALRRLAAGQLEDGKVRILAFGASHTQADIYTGYLRTYLQQLYGNGGPGFVNVSKLDTWDRKLEVRMSSTGFKVQRLHGRHPATTSYLGLLGASAVATGPSANARLDLIGSPEDRTGPMTVELHALGSPFGSEVEILLDGVARARFNTRTTSPTPLFPRVYAPKGVKRIELRKIGRGTLRVFGVVIERASSGVVVDNLGIQGTRLTDMLEGDEAVWSAAVRERKPQLISLAYGTNEYASGVDLKQYRSELEQAFDRLKRAAPDASCLVIGPGDLGRVRTPKQQERLALVIETHREFAIRYGCGFWDAFAFMGGQGSMFRWASAKPPFAAHDKTHLNLRGYVLMGMRLADALLSDPLDTPEPAAAANPEPIPLVIPEKAL